MNSSIRNTYAVALRFAFGVSIIAAFLPTPDAMALPPESLMPSGHLECVPVARALSGIQIRGDALTWWDQANGKYGRGHEPKRGAVLAFRPHGSMNLGHVATVSHIIDDRTILVTHANWSIINGKRGQIERDVKVIDASPAGDWSLVRVWYAPIQNIGTTVWPVHGFIYPDSTPSLHSVVEKDGLPTNELPVRPTGHLNYLGSLLRSWR